jgi:transposase
MLLDRSLDEPTAIRVHLGAIFVSLELSRKTWLITSLSPGNGQKMSTRQVEGGDLAGLRRHFSELQRKALERTGKKYPIITIQEAGLDGFWLHRALQQEGIESYVVDAASIAAARRRRRAKTDKIDGEALIRTLMAYKRGEPRVCSMVVAPSPEAEDERRVSRERQVLLEERVAHVNRIRGLLLSQGILDYAPLRRDRRRRLEGLRTGDGRELPAHTKAQIRRELDRLELLLEQIKAVEAERDALLAGEAGGGSRLSQCARKLVAFRGIAANGAIRVASEGLCRDFANRRQVASYAGLAGTPWRSGAIVHEQGVSKAGNPRLRTTMVELAWLWLRHQPQSALARWFREQGPRDRKGAIVALARKLLVALWKYVTHGVLIEGAVMKRAAA